MTEFFSDLLFLFQRLTWLSVIDILLVTLIFFVLLYLLHDTQAMALLRGVILLVIAVALLTSLVNLPAFSWLLRTTLPALLLSIPVIFSPEIRRTLERLGRAEGFWPAQRLQRAEEVENAIQVIVTAAARLSGRSHGALIVLQRFDSLEEYVNTGVRLEARLTPELLLQVFYPNTPLHDGAAIVVDGRLTAAACVMPLSSSGILNRTPERQMGLRHRAALGISETSDAVVVVVSEETGSISVAHAGRMIRHLDEERLSNILLAFYRPQPGPSTWLRQIFPSFFPKEEE